MANVISGRPQKGGSTGIFGSAGESKKVISCVRFGDCPLGARQAISILQWTGKWRGATPGRQSEKTIT